MPYKFVLCTRGLHGDLYTYAEFATPFVAAHAAASRAIETSRTIVILYGAQVILTFN